MNKIKIVLKRRLDLATKADVAFVRTAETLSADGTLYYSYVPTAFSVNDSWKDRHILYSNKSDPDGAAETLQSFGVVESVDVSSQDDTSIGITGNPQSFRCMRTMNSLANIYQMVAGIWPRNFAQGTWDSSNMVCFDYVVAVTGANANNGILSLTDSTVTLRSSSLIQTQDGNLVDSTHYLDRFIWFPTRDGGVHSLQRYRVSGAEARYDGAVLEVALEVAENDGGDPPRTPLSTANSLYNLGIRVQAGSDNTNSVIVAGVCHQLHWSADSSDALCVNADYESGERYISGAPQRTNILGWNTDALQYKGLTSDDSTVNTGFHFDGLTLYPVIRDRMTFGTSETFSSIAFWHHSLSGDGDNEAGVNRYNAETHNAFYKNTRKVSSPGTDLPYNPASGITQTYTTDWSLDVGGVYHSASVAGLVADRINDKGSVGVAPGCKIDPELSISRAYQSADYGIADVISYSTVIAYTELFGTRDYYDVVGDKADIPLGSFANATTVEYLDRNDGWLIVPPFGNFDEYYTFDTEVMTVGAFHVWDGTTADYAYGEAVDFVSPVPVLAPGGHYDTNGVLPGDKSTLTVFAGQSCTTPCGAGHMLLLKEARPELNYTEAKQILANSSRKFPDMTAASSYWHHLYGYGKPDIDAAVSTDLTAAGCPPPRGLIVDGENTGYASLRWTNPHYRQFQKTKIVRKRTDTTNAYPTATIVYGSSNLDKWPAGTDYAEKFKWVDVIITDANAIADIYDTNNDSTFLGKMTVYLDVWASGHGYESDYDHANHADGFGVDHRDIIPGPGDSTHGFDWTTGQPEIGISWAPPRSSPGYVIDSTGMWFGCIVDKLTDICKKFYDEGTPLFGIFMDDWNNMKYWNPVLTSTIAGDPEDGTNSYDRNGDINDSSAAFILYPEMWNHYITHDYHLVDGLEWGQMTFTEQQAVQLLWFNDVMIWQMYSLEEALGDVIDQYCVPEGRLILNGAYRRMSGATPYYPKSSRAFESPSQSQPFADLRWPTLWGTVYKASYYCQPKDFMIMRNKGASGDWDDWNCVYGGTDAEAIEDSNQAATLALTRGAYVVHAFGESPHHGGSIYSYFWNPNDADNRWPSFVSNSDYSENHSDGTVVYEGVGQRTTDYPGEAGNYAYTAFAQNTWGDWSEGGIALAQALKRKSKTTFTVGSHVTTTEGITLVYGSISPGGDSFSVDSETAWNDSTVVAPIGHTGLPHGQGWYAVGANASEVYPVKRVSYYGSGDVNRGKIKYITLNSDEIDPTSLYAGQTLDIRYLSLHVGNHIGSTYNSRSVTEETFPREPVTLTSSVTPWFTSFDPPIDATAVFDRASNTVQMYIRNVRNPMGISDIHIIRKGTVAADTVNWFPSDRITYQMAVDSTSFNTLTETGQIYYPFTSYKFIPYDVSGVAGTPVYVLDVPTSPFGTPILVHPGFFSNFAPEFAVTNDTNVRLTLTIYKNGIEYATGGIDNGEFTFLDLFWVEGDSYKVTFTYGEFTSEFSDEITPALEQLIPDAKINSNIPDYRYLITVGDSTFSEYIDVYNNSIYTSAVSRVGAFRLGQPVWTGPVNIVYQYRTNVVPRRYRGISDEEAIPPQFEFWNDQAGGSMLLRFEANPIEFEFEFGVRNKRLSTLDGPDKLQLMYQDHIIRQMVWRNIPIQKYHRFIGSLRKYIGRDVWLDSKDFTMPASGRWPLAYSSGYRYKISIVDVIVKPVEGGGKQRVDISLKYKLLTTRDEGAI